MARSPLPIDAPPAGATTPRRRLRALALGAVACAGLSLAGPGVVAQTFVDPGFASELVVTLPAYSPVGVAWAPDGRMFIWQKNGIVRVFKNGALLATPFLNFSAKVNTYSDNGMWGLAFDPSFATNGYVYLTYVYEPGGNTNDTGPKTSRLVRVTADPANPDVMLSGSEVSILDGFPDDAATHAMGSIRFASDGTIFVGNGDGASPNFADPSAWGAQQLDSPRGKILRIEPDGSAPPDNPFYDGTDSIRSKVWCYGVRNPYRFSLHPVTGEPYFADVGWNSWEEVDHGVVGGNFGWPCYEGNGTQPDYQAILPACASIPAPIPPMVTYSHASGDLGDGGTCSVGGDFYRAITYPLTYQGNYFYADYSGQWIHRVALDASGNLTGTYRFATGLAGPTCVEQGPDGLLYYVDFPTGQVRRIRFNGPVAVATATPSSGYSPLPVAFSSANSINPGGGSLTYSWDFGDGATSTAANPSHTYTAAGVVTFHAALTIRDSQMVTSTSTVAVTVNSLPPTPSIHQPANGTGFMPGQVVYFEGSATDPDEGVLPPSSLSWVVLLHHNTHVHTGITASGSAGEFTVENHGTVGTFYYEIVLTATDQSGLATSVSVNVPVSSDAVPPTPPTSLSATNAGLKIALSWSGATDNAAVASYLVERKGGASPSFVQIGSTVDTAYVDAGLLGNTSYSYRVKAVDASGNVSLPSPEASATTPAMPAGLLAAYDFEEGEGGSTTDISGNGNTGTLFDATWTPAGKYGTALAFNGSTATVNVADSPALRLTSAMTLEAWVNPSVVSSAWRDVVYKANDNYFLEATSTPSGQPAGGGKFGGANTIAMGPTPISVGTWTHLAVTYDGSMVRLYRNGSQVGSVAESSTLVTSTNPLQIGGDLLYGQYFAGLIDEVRVYNRALDATAIQTDMATPVGGPLPTLPTSAGRVPDFPFQGALLELAKSGTSLLLSWGSSCNGGDTDYEVYEGTLGAFASHVPVLCSTGGLTQATIAPASGGRYYLVAPRNSTREGSLGLTGTGSERPQGATVCLPRLVRDCP